jgi:plastocyanin
MRKLIAVVAVVPVLAVVASVASADDPPARAAATKTVVIGDNFFSPKTLKVTKGTTVQWTWGKGNTGTAVEHNVMGTKGNKFGPTPDTLRPDRPVRKRITKTTTVYCTIHSTTMKMTIKVVPPKN